MESKVAALRKALDADVEYINQMPDFDVGGAHQLYEALLKPIEAGWRPAKQLVIATNGALGLFPLGLLPTEAVEVSPKTDEGPYFATYRKVAWLARTQPRCPPAVGFRRCERSAVLPLRASSPGRLSIGFGDPLFKAEASVSGGIDKGCRSCRCERVE